MEFGSREEAYRWSERTGFRGRCPIVIRSGAYSHRFVLACEGERVSLYYQGLA
jgi:hypothetical protein